MRHIIFDTETTGFDAEGEDRIVEIGALEAINFIPTGRVYHQYINPQRDIPAEVVAVHGIDNERVKNEPVFSQIAQDFIDFIGEDGILVAHNATFDMRFINAEFKRTGFPVVKNKVIDTLEIAKQKFPGARNNLDALCKRFEIDNSSRVYHGALLDSELLAEVFIELSGGRQTNLSLEPEQNAAQNVAQKSDKKELKQRVKRELRQPPESDFADFNTFIQKEMADNALWYVPKPEEENKD